MIGISGASGQLGRRVVELVMAAVGPGQVVTLTRTPEKLADLAAQGVQVRQADFAEPEGLVTALQGVERLLLVSTDAVGTGARLNHHLNAIHAAEQVGVQHLIYTSAANADKITMAALQDHGATEVALQQGQLPYTILRNNLYAEAGLNFAASALATGEIRTSAANGAVGYVTREDCARAAAAVLTTPGHHGAIYDITGPAAVTYADVAQALRAASGHEIHVVPVTSEEYQQGLVAAGLPKAVAEMLLGFDRMIGDGYLDVTSQSVQELTGRSPVSFADFVASRREQLMAAPAV